MNFSRLCEVRPSCVNEVAIFIINRDSVSNFCFCTIEIERREKFSVGHRFNSITSATHANEFFYVRIPGCHVFIPNRPIKAISKPCGTIKFKIAPSLTRSSPGERLASYLVTTNPIEWLFLDIRMVLILDKKMRGIVTKSCRFADQRIFFEVLL